jgi:hypothetical protein
VQRYGGRHAPSTDKSIFQKLFGSLPQSEMTVFHKLFAKFLGFHTSSPLVCIAP